MNSSVGDYLNRLARALLDDGYQDGDPWILEGRALFALAQDKLDNNRTSWEIGVTWRIASRSGGSPSTRAPICSPRPIATTTAISGNSRNSISTRPPTPATSPSSRCASTSA